MGVSDQYQKVGVSNQHFSVCLCAALDLALPNESMMHMIFLLQSFPREAALVFVGMYLYIKAFSDLEILFLMEALDIA